MFEVFFERVLWAISSYMWGEAQFQSSELFPAFLWGGVAFGMDSVCFDTAADRFVGGKAFTAREVITLWHFFGLHVSLYGGFPFGKCLRPGHGSPVDVV